jgi:2-polyprenyl-3-methyl-5-hydroxy-6-metoxy-1,4-benzoquinol methylase
MSSTADADYADRLHRLQRARWKRFAPNPYRWYLRHLHLGRVLEIGCGVGRILRYLAPDAVGVDRNAAAVAKCRAAGLSAFTSEEFDASVEAARPFDALVMAHLLEHLTEPEGDALVARYLPLVRPGGRIVIITPQERGQRSDATHVRVVDHSVVAAMCDRLGLRVVTRRSFPLPRFAGRWFVYNEFVTIALK